MKILVISASLREESLNRKLARLVLKELKAHRYQPKFIDLRDYELPLYNQDFEAQKFLPPKVKKLTKLIKEAQGIIIVSPEYNGGVPGGLKNMIDWISRQPHTPWQNKIYCLCGVTVGPLGTYGNFVNLSQIFLKLKGFVYGNYCGISFGEKAFDSKNQLVQPYDQKQLKSTISGFLKLIHKT